MHYNERTTCGAGAESKFGRFRNVHRATSPPRRCVSAHTCVNEIERSLGADSVVDSLTGRRMICESMLDACNHLAAATH